MKGVELNIDFLPNLSTDEISSIIRAFPNNVLNNLKQILPQNFLKEIFSLLSLVDKRQVICLRQMKLELLSI
ncbi:hypothetical protein QKA_2176 [Clostridioides difficile DA00165]|nr:hypothetical protein QKA_2176 [Clostridioides difficile DA00165]